MTRYICVLIALLTVISPAGAADRRNVPSKDPVVDVSPPAGEVPEAARVLRPIEPKNLSPMHRELREAVESEQTRVEELNARFSRTVLLEEKIAIQKQIETIKRNGMIAVFEIQLRYAEVEGRAAVAGQLRATIEAIRNPKMAPMPGK